MVEERAPPRRADTLELVEQRREPARLAALPVEADRETVRLVADPQPSNDPARMQMFRKREYVRIGDPASVRARDLWLERGQQMLRDVQLPVHADVANDPFFGRAGKMLAVNQRDQALKFELLVPICSEEKPTACVSCNYHEDHFGHSFHISLADGSPAHTACVGFGLERIALALFKWHGFDVGAWPTGVRKTLGF